MKQLIYIITFTLAFVSGSISDLASPGAGFVRLDSFDEMLNGSINGQGDWVGNDPGAPDGALITIDPPAWFQSKALQNNPDNYPNRGNAYRRLNGKSISKGSTATLYFQLSVDDLADSDFSVGISDVVSPDIFSTSQPFVDFEIEINFSSNGLSIRNGNTYEDGSNFTIENDTLLHVWLVVDHATNSFEVYIDDAFHNQIQVTSAGGSSFQFRNGSSSLPLTSFILQNQGLNGSDSYLDNLYVDLSGKNLSSPAGNFELTDNFENYNLGTLNGQDNWVLNRGDGQIVNDPVEVGNKTIRVTGEDTSIYKQVNGIADNSKGTLFFRMYRSGTVNGFAGLSDVLQPSVWIDYETQFGSQFTAPKDFRVQDGGNFLTLNSGDYYENTWLCVWLVPDTQVDQYRVYVKGGAVETRSLLTTGSQSIFDFRNRISTNPLKSLFIQTGPDSIGGLYIDDIYIDNNNENLSHPSGLCPPGDEGTGSGENNSNNPIDNPIPEVIQPDGTTIQLETIATIPATGSNPRTRINYLFHAKDGTDRLFANDLRGEIFVINPNSGAVSEYLNVSDYFPEFKTAGSLNAGLSTFAFHPEFKTNGKLYTIHLENPNGTVDFGHPNTNRPNTTHSVIVEWTASDPNSNSYAGSQPRELMRVLQITPLHGVQQLEFNRTAQKGEADYGKLYVSIGDSELEPFFSNVAQDKGYPQGKILRIDPLGNNSVNGQYGIPNDNPYANSNDGTLKEIFAIGFRNPIRFDWDPVTKIMLTSVIGQNNIEEVELVEAGRNYGWNAREGTFRFDPSNPGNVYPIPQNSDNPDFTYPVAQYDHDEGFAIIGGFIYRGSMMPRLYGSYIFGDIVKGHLFHIKLDDIQLGAQAPIHKLTLLNSNGDPTTFNSVIGASRADLRFGLDSAGEIYVMSKQDGVIRKLFSNQDSPENRPPTISLIEDQTNKVGETVSIQINASDPDGDALTFSAVNLPEGLSINSSGLISGVPTTSGTFFVRVQVADGQGGQSFKEIEWIIIPELMMETPTPTPTPTTPPTTPNPVSSPTLPATPTPGGTLNPPAMTQTPVIPNFTEFIFLPFAVR